MSALHSHTGRSFRTRRHATGVQCSRCIGRCALHTCVVCGALPRVRCVATCALRVCNVCAVLQRVHCTGVRCAATWPHRPLRTNVSRISSVKFDFVKIPDATCPIPDASCPSDAAAPRGVRRASVSAALFGAVPQCGWLPRMGLTWLPRKTG
jgi:hypothetical protein